MFLNLDSRGRDDIIAVDSAGGKLVWSELMAEKDELEKVLEKRSVVFTLCNNTAGALAAYLDTVMLDSVPVMLSSKTDKELLGSLYRTYEPAYVWLPAEDSIPFEGTETVYEGLGYRLLKTGFERYEINPELQLLMTTSGSTGSPKLVRYKRGNLDANAKNVAKAFGWTSQERPLCDLAMNYTMGLNVVNTHIYAGATVYLTNENIMSAPYWDFIKNNKLTNLTGVPFGYELMLKLRFTRMDLPYLTTLSQGGGKLNDKTFRTLAEYAAQSGKRFVATFGTTETAARMTFLEPGLALTKTGSIGKAIPEGKLMLTDDDGKEITSANTEGELVYSGPNVTMGYAVCREELAKGDEFCGTYHTGDIAVRDEDGCYYIVGRKSRFLKMLGYRVSLDQTERLIKDNYNIEVACTGSDDKLIAYITRQDKKDEILDFISEKTGFYKSLFEVRVIDEIPKNETGKIMYKNLLK